MLSDNQYAEFACEAMTTRFAVFVAGEDREYAGQAAQAALAEIQRLEGELSRYIESSDIARINRLAAGEKTLVGLETLECLQAAAKAHQQTRGAFDVTVGPLTACYKRAAGAEPSDEDIAQALQRVGMQHIELKPDTHEIRVLRDGIQVDLGGIGKGYALDRAVTILEDWGVGHAMLHGGESTVLALDAPPGEDGWPIMAGSSAFIEEEGFPILLKEQALSGSGSELKGRHVFDPRTGRPVQGNLAAWSLCETGAMADALSTAFLVMPANDVADYCKRYPDTSGMVVEQTPDGPKRRRFGVWPERKRKTWD